MLYVVMSNGIPVDVQKDVRMAESSARQFSTKYKTAQVIPVIPLEPDEVDAKFDRSELLEGTDFEDVPTNPQMELPFDQR